MEALIFNVTFLKENISTMTVLGCVTSLVYISYYLLYVVNTPIIVCGDAKFKQFLTDHCPISREKYWPTWYAFQGHIQTVLRNFIQCRPKVDYSAEYIKCPDGGELKIDWVENDHNSKHTKDQRPTVLVLPGLTGDVAVVIDHIKKKYPEAPLMGVGISLGGILLFNYLAHHGDSASICAAMCISAPYNVPKCIKSLETPLNYHLFNRVLAKGMCRFVQRHADIFEDLKDVTIPHVLKSESIRDFDERFTCKMFGFESPDHYYEAATLHTKFHALRRPVLCLNAADDPFCPVNYAPLKDAETNDNIAIVLTSHGGHIGFLEGTYPRQRNYMYRWVRQFVSAVFEQGIKSE
ncbi:abhydrolase domain-containing protein 3 [Plakobranchus ocellatus]|uniref:Abhydrolase domain-containing protein 3 n=1 Tax=Plakobranchus ocellatus TaxID=259542 RepID=A0AAV4E065_9GAST|nr:abhydrolase domain-containing protein 3 [Plakobranchus ocellatus]